RLDTAPPLAKPYPGRSTRYTGCAAARATRYTFASRVLPGVALVRAMRCRTSALIRLDLPTFERPTNAISGSRSAGKSAATAALLTKAAAVFTGHRADAA